MKVEELSQYYTEKLHVDCSEKEGKVKKFWQALGFDRFYDILMPEMTDSWNQMKKLDLFHWLRCHGIFRPEELDNPNWREFSDQKKALDTIINAGFRPIVELSKIPDKLANPDNPLGFDGDCRGWADFITEFLSFLFKTYGEDEVKKWYFEFWNEPDHHFWSGDQPLDWQGISNLERINDYCKMYDWTAKAVRDFCPQLKIGGPSLTGNTIFLREFLKHCRSGKNYADGSIGSPLDFFSFHIYSNSPEREPCMENILGRFIELDKLMKKYWEKPIPWLLTEWGVTWGGGRTADTFPVKHRNTNRAAVFSLKLLKEMRHFPIELALFWGFSEWGWRKRTSESTDFSGHRSILTYSGIERPIAGAYRLLEQLEGEWCHVHRMTDTNNVDALCSINDNKITIVFWNHDPDNIGKSYPTRTEVIIDKLPVSKGRLRTRLMGYTVEHNTHCCWQQLNSPAQPSMEQVKRIQEFSQPKMIKDEIVEFSNSIYSTGEFQIRPGEFYLLTLDL